MKQTRFHSLVEIGTSTTIGYMVAVLSQMVIFPLFNVYVSFGENFIIAAWFTVISLIRGYMVRRWFNNLGSEIDDFLARIIVKFPKSSSFQRSNFHREKNVEYHGEKNVEFPTLHPLLQESIDNDRQNKTKGQ